MMMGEADCYNRVSAKIMREKRKVMVLAKNGRVMATTDIPKINGSYENYLVGIYDATLETYCKDQLNQDLIYAEKCMI